MTKYREILRLTALGLSQRDICSSAGVSQKTVSKVQKRARELHIEWPLDVSCIIKVPKVADKNGENCISILEKNATGFLISSGAYIPS